MDTTINTATADSNKIIALLESQNRRLKTIEQRLDIVAYESKEWLTEAETVHMTGLNRKALSFLRNGEDCPFVWKHNGHWRKFQYGRESVEKYIKQFSNK